MRASTTGESLSPESVFRGVAEQHPGFDDVLPNGPGKPVHIHSRAPDCEHFEIDFPGGVAQVKEILFEGILHVRKSFLPVSNTQEYRLLEGQPISHLATFDTHDVSGGEFSIEFHRVIETGETQLTVRRAPPE